MGKQQNRLAETLGATRTPPSGVQRVSRDTLLRSSAHDEAERIYRRLGGIQDEVPAFGALSWDMNLGGVEIELDETQHFNRYRSATLDSVAYVERQGIPVDKYRTWCAVHEREALARHSQGARFWSKPNADRQFGPSGTPGDLDGAGSSRYKQRAFYDFLRDLAPWVAGTSIVRVSVWDQIELHGTTLQIGRALLAPPSPEVEEALRSLVLARVRLAATTKTRGFTP